LRFEVVHIAHAQVYDPMTGLESLLVAPISRASAAQRAGRAGRVRMGHAFRLCTEEAFRSDLTDATVRTFRVTRKSPRRTEAFCSWWSPKAARRTAPESGE
jgi:hypothetical protein